MEQSKEAATRYLESKEAQDTLNQLRKETINNAPELAKANDLKYRALKRPYHNTNNDVLIIVANGWYFPTPEVKLYFESSANHVFRLMQNNSSQFFNMLTYHTAQWTSSLGLLTTPKVVTIQDAYGTHTIPVESY